MFYAWRGTRGQGVLRFGGRGYSGGPCLEGIGEGNADGARVQIVAVRGGKRTEGEDLRAQVGEGKRKEKTCS